MNDRHETTNKYFCTVESCKYEENSDQGKFFSREDNLKRHMGRHKQEGETEKQDDNVGQQADDTGKEGETESQGDDARV
jgi:hypothetical protein